MHVRQDQTLHSDFRIHPSSSSPAPLPSLIIQSSRRTNFNCLHKGSNLVLKTCTIKDDQSCNWAGSGQHLKTVQPTSSIDPSHAKISSIPLFKLYIPPSPSKTRRTEGFNSLQRIRLSLTLDLDDCPFTVKTGIESCLRSNSSVTSKECTARCVISPTGCAPCPVTLLPSTTDTLERWWLGIPWIEMLQLCHAAAGC